MPGGRADAYRTGAGPGVLLFMDAIGLRPQIESMADRIAGWGYSVLAPNLFWRDGTADDLMPKADLRVPENREAFFGSGVMDRVASITPDIARADAEMWLANLDDPFAATGYCFGGRLALRAGADFDLAAVGMFHTGGIVTDAPDSPHLVVPGLKAEVLAGHADHDHSNSPEQIAVFDAALTAAGVAHTTAVYPDAPHGYTMADTAMYQEAGAERHYEELRALLSRSMPSSSR